MQDSTYRIIYVILYSTLIIAIYGLIFVLPRSDSLDPLGVSLVVTGCFMLPFWYLLPSPARHKLGIKLFHPYALGEGRQSKMWYSIAGFLIGVGTIIWGFF